MAHNFPSSHIIRSDRCDAEVGSKAILVTVGCECPGLIVSRGRGVAALGSDTAGDCARETGRFPGVETADQVRDVTEAGTPQDTRGNGAPIAAFTMHNQQFPAVQLL